MEISPRISGSLDSRAGPSSSHRADKPVAGSGSSEDSMASELGRLSEENAHYRRKISELMGKSPAQPLHSRANSGPLGGLSTERLRDQVKGLKRENGRLLEVNNTLERRISGMRMNGSSDQLWRCKEEIRNLRKDNADLLREKQKFDRTAEYVCQRVLKIIGAARREGNFNSQLVGELKRWNEKLEEENHRLYSIIERMQNKSSISERDSAVAEANILSKNHDRDRDGNAALVKQLETQNVKLQEEISKLSDQAISLQNLSSSSSGSSGMAAPRTPSNHEDGLGRRSRTPERDAIAASERLRSGDLNRRKSRNMSLESVSSAATKELENDQLRVEKKNLEDEISRIGKHLDEIRRESSISKELQASNAQQSIEIQKLMEASAQVKSLEEANASQAAEIERLLEVQLSVGDDTKASVVLKEEFAELEDDCLKLAAEVERLQPFAERSAELEAEIEAYKEELAIVRAAQAAISPEEVASLKEGNVEIQRTLEALAAEKSVLQAQLRQLMEEQAKLQNDNNNYKQQVEALQERADEAASLEAELAVMGQIRGQNATYRNQLGSLRSENMSLQQKASDLAQQLTDAQDSLVQMENKAAAANIGVPLGVGHGPSSPHGEESRRSFSSFTSETCYTETNSNASSSHDELAALRAQMKELQAQATKAVEMNVEMTSLRNQIKTYEEQERQHAELVNRLKAESVALKQDSRLIASLRAEIADLKARVAQAEDAQKQSEAGMASLLSETVETELSKQHALQSREISALQAQCSRHSAEAEQKDKELQKLQSKHDTILQELRTTNDQNSRMLQSSGSEAAALRVALSQEQAESSRVSAEAAELHSLLQTGKLERHAQAQTLEELRTENLALLKRVADLDAKIDEQEKMLDSVLARAQGNGHSSPETRIKPHTPQPDEIVPAETLHPTNGNGYYSSDEGWLSPNVSPFKQMNPNQMNGAASDRTRKSALNGKSKGFGNFFKLGSSGKKEKAVASPGVLPVQQAAHSEPQPDIAYEDPEEQVISVYEQFVDHDDIDGFMSALGFDGFVGPTEPEDLEGAFVSARYACRPEAFYGRSLNAQAKGRATLELLEAWQAAWQTALQEG